MRVPPLLMHQGRIALIMRTIRSIQPYDAMATNSITRTRLLRALHGDDAMDAIHAVIANRRIAPIIATSNRSHPITRAFAALSSAAPSLLTDHDHHALAAHATMRRLLESGDGIHVIWTWAQSAPAAHARDLADSIRKAVRAKQCPSVALALIHPDDESAALLRLSDIIARVIRRWGQSRPDDPTWWTTHLSATALKRLTGRLAMSDWIAATCLPWLTPQMIHALPPPDAWHPAAVDAARNAFAFAAPSARALHSDIVQRIAAAPQSRNPGPLACLAHALNDDTVWNPVHAMLMDDPDAAGDLVRTLPWDAIARDVQERMVRLAPHSAVCAAIAAARGRRPLNASADIPWRFGNATAAFFAALDPAVWDMLDAHEQRAWLIHLSSDQTHLAVRSLGARPPILATANGLDDPLVAMARLHAADESDLRTILFPVALQHAPIADIAPILASMPEIPGDPVATLATACRSIATTDASEPARRWLARPDHLAAAMVIQRCVDAESATIPIHERTAALASVMQRRTHADLEALRACLPATTRAHLRLVPDARIVARQAAPGHVHALLHALRAIAALPADAALPAFLAFIEVDRARNHHAQREAASALMHALRRHGDLALSIVDALIPAIRAILLPPADSAPLADALRDLMRVDPWIAHRLAHALRTSQWTDIASILLETPPDHARAVWRAFPADVRTAILDHASVAASVCIDPRHVREATAQWRRLAAHVPLSAIALASLAMTAPDIPLPIIATLSVHADALRTMLPLLRDDVRSALLTHPAMELAIADMTSGAHSGQPHVGGRRRRP